MHPWILLTAGWLIGGLFGALVMCLFQVNRPEQPLSENLRKGQMK